MTQSQTVDEPQNYPCPRCGADAIEEWYGPCRSCRDTLRATLGGDAREIAPTDYVPKMNVTPDAVATKE